MLTRAQDDAWTLPNPPQLNDRLQADGSSHRELLEDVEVELLAWMYKISTETGAVNPGAVEGWPSADRDVERTLAAQGCMYHILFASAFGEGANWSRADPRHTSLRRSGTSNEHLVYVMLLEPHYTPSFC